MLKLTAIIFLISLTLIFLIYYFEDYEQVNNQEDIELLKINKKVSFEGVIENQRFFDDFVIYESNKIDMTCSGCGYLKGKKVEIKGKISEYQGKKQLEISSFRILYDLD